MNGKFLRISRQAPTLFQTLSSKVQIHLDLTKIQTQMSLSMLTSLG